MSYPKPNPTIAGKLLLDQSSEPNFDVTVLYHKKTTKQKIKNASLQ